MTRMRCNYATNNTYFAGIIGKTNYDASIPLFGQQCHNRASRRKITIETLKSHNNGLIFCFVERSPTISLKYKEKECLCYNDRTIKFLFINFFYSTFLLLFLLNAVCMELLSCNVSTIYLN